ncbi:complement factor H-related protein 4-like isoform X2 [Denticeps clupeoides]|nr:complement factor H-related protein 4-like isoform X2 [Denticeps clupeoides]
MVCETGYELNISARCENGKWIFLPICTFKEIIQHKTSSKPFECGDPPAIGNGYIANIQSLTITYECKSFYKLQGPSHVTCLNSGQWSELPICMSNFCKLEGKIDHIKTLQSALVFEEGTTVLLSCEDEQHSRGPSGQAGARGQCNGGQVHFRGCGLRPWVVNSTSWS